jgi:hypothetical protein
MAVVGSRTSKTVRVFGSRSVSIRIVLLAAVIVAGTAAAATILLNRSSGPLYGCSSLSDCRSVAAGHGLKPVLLPNAKLTHLRLHDGAVDVDDAGNVDLVMNLADLSQPTSTTVTVGVGLHRNWFSMCSSSKAHPGTTSSGLRYCSFDLYCSERAVFASRGISYSIEVFGKSGCASEFASQASSRVQGIINSFN